MYIKSTDLQSPTEKQNLAERLQFVRNLKPERMDIGFFLVVVGISWAILLGGTNIIAGAWVGRHGLFVFAITACIALLLGWIIVLRNPSKPIDNIDIEALVLKDIESGVVQVVTVDVVEMIQIDEPSNGRWKGIYHVGNNECFVIREDDFPPDSQDAFFFSRIRIRSFLHTKEVTAIFADGKCLQPLPTILPAEVDQGKLPSGELFHVSWPDVISEKITV